MSPLCSRVRVHPRGAQVDTNYSVRPRPLATSCPLGSESVRYVPFIGDSWFKATFMRLLRDSILSTGKRLERAAERCNRDFDKGEASVNRNLKAGHQPSWTSAARRLSRHSSEDAGRSWTGRRWGRIPSWRTTARLLPSTATGYPRVSTQIVYAQRPLRRILCRRKAKA